MVNINNPNDNEIIVKILNNLGQILDSHLIKGHSAYEINKLNAGIYYLQYEENKKIVTKKIIIL